MADLLSSTLHYPQRIYPSTNMAQTAGRIALLTAGAVATGFVGYAIYFDYMRRNSPDFRRSLRA